MMHHMGSPYFPISYKDEYNGILGGYNPVGSCYNCHRAVGTSGYAGFADLDE